MAVKLVVTKEELDGLPADVQKEYKPRDGHDGQYVLDWAEAEGLRVEDVGGLKSALEKERREKRELAEAAKAFEGLDPKEAREKLAELEKLRAAGGETAKKAEALAEAAKAEMARLHKAEMEKRDAELAKVRGHLERATIDTRLIGGLKESGVTDEGLSVLPALLRGQVKMRETDGGQLITVVVGEDGTERVGDAQGSPMGIPHLVEEAKGKFPSLFKASGATGGGDPAADQGRPANVGRKGVISRSDASALSANIDAIAAGEVTVQ